MTYNNRIPITPRNAWIMDYENDMMDGVYIDGDHDYAFVHNDHEQFDDFVEMVQTMGVNTMVMDECVDLTAFPHLHVVASLAALTVKAAEMILSEHED
jgi:hypothetical protein